MSSNLECCEFLRGKGFSKPYSSLDGYGYNYGNNYGGASKQENRGVFIGNIPAMSIDINSSFRQIINSTVLNYESECGQVSIDSVEFSMQVSCKSSANLAQAFWGTASEFLNVLPPVEDEPLEVPVNGIYPACSFHAFKPSGVDPSSVVITRTDTAATLVNGVDYIANEFGIELINGFSLANGETLNASYSYSSTSYKKIEPLTEVKKPLTITFIGRNAGDMKPVMVTLHKVLLSPASSYALISEDFENLEFSGVLLADATQPQGSSQYFNITKI